MEIILTDDLLKRSDLTVTDSYAGEESDAVWIGHLEKVLLGRQKRDLVLLINPSTHFVAGLLLKRNQPIKDLSALIRQALEEALVGSGYDADTVANFLDLNSEPSYFIQPNSEQTQLLEEVLTYYKRGLAEKTPIDQLNFNRNRYPYQLDGSQELYRPIELMSQLVSTATDQPVYRYQALELLIQLDLYESVVKRRIVIDEQANFSNLHYAIQDAMKWENDHLYEFKLYNKQNKLVASLTEEQFMSPFGDDQSVRDYRLADMKDQWGILVYTYNFGDNWEHTITINNAYEWDQGRLPYLLEAEGVTPPEDSGGVGGYLRKKEAYFDPNNPDHDWALNWFYGHDFELDESEKEPRVLRDEWIY